MNFDIFNPAEKAVAHDRVYRNIDSSDVFQKLLQQAMGENYPNGSKQYSFVNLSALRWITNHILLTPNDVIIDIGCGDGSLTKWISQMSSKGINGFDISKVAIDSASKKNIKGCQFYVGDYCHLPITNSSVNVIVALDCVQHASSSDLLAQEMSRICSSGGKFIFTHWMQLQSASELAIHDPFCFGLAKSGFKITDIFDFDPLLSMQFRFYALAFANREIVEPALGTDLYNSLMAEAKHLYPKIGKVGHLGVIATKE